MSAAAHNAQVWENLYATGRNDLRYPNEMLVRLAAGLLPSSQPVRVLDYGCGTGANTAHLASLGHEMHGTEVSASALEIARARLQAAGREAALRLVTPGAPLPFDHGFFDAVIAWQVIYYNDRQGWAGAVSEIERVLRPGGIVLVATAAPGDVSQREAQPLGNSMYRSEVTGQAGCTLTIPEREELDALFPGRTLDVGEYLFRFGPRQAHHWIISYRTPT
ncbi:class I SAM-dependent methyltransferase [Ramlibacter sp. G-1-2-2]|uniref:Class I SAM-dependent methyltransferase n=1 Tax=Ramlibacter agri TaxID=2728837 RepID=A0A848H8S1_9BURK|nr:class I SAM-dependent methyltransferase [Ramlibacter agri]NML46877.1 class I SAM-dependent methyltransferase [Ramlibacter agri]